MEDRKSEITFEENIKILLNSETDIKNKAIIIEELSELQKVITKDIRNKFNKEDLLEEMADVFIVLHMAKQLYGISDEELSDSLDKKMERNLKRVGVKESF